MIGTSNYSKCQEKTDYLIDSNFPCNYSSCSFSGIYQPEINGEYFIAFSGFYYTVSFLNLGKFPTLHDLQNAAIIYCNFTSQELLDNYGNLTYIYDYCFNSAYIISLMYKGWHFPFDDNITMFTDNINGVEIGWPLGAMIYQVSLITNYSDLTWNGLYIGLVVAAGFLVLVLLFLTIFYTYRKNQINTTENLQLLE
eukprot:TRINITY_DN1852_c0_g3_i2.p1 TRINITY_DN1852_c0_g3~~TRINITY_DN1852_c0_g3_i2.p1  ORF type:complete len:196 (+),score=12.77 TRINITY_DN1852_c0_g3_i2:942-1529(+)